MDSLNFGPTNGNFIDVPTARVVMTEVGDLTGASPQEAFNVLVALNRAGVLASEESATNALAFRAMSDHEVATHLTRDNFNKIQAIKALRYRANVSLVDAKRACDKAADILLGLGL